MRVSGVKAAKQFRDRRGDCAAFKERDMTPTASARSPSLITQGGLVKWVLGDSPFRGACRHRRFSPSTMGM